MDRALESTFGTITLTGQQQPISTIDVDDETNIDDLLTACPDIGDFIIDNITNEFSSSIDNENVDINMMIHSSNTPNNITNLETQLSRTSIDDNDISELIHTYMPNDQSQQSIISEQNAFPEIWSSQPASIDIGSSPTEPQANDNLFGVQVVLQQQQQIYKEAKKSKKTKSRQQQSTTVAPIEYFLNSGDCQPCTTQMQNDYVYQQQTLNCDAFETKKIQIIAQPRSTFRPRTLNESKNSSHYVRCAEGIKPEHPTIAIPQEWNFHADVNFIEVAWVGLDKESHPYTLYNKSSSATLEDHVMIFKQNEPNILYFRLTNEDFSKGYKTFMLELIKSKQDDVITKELIRTRQLEHSMLRFTRLFQLGKGDYHRDDGSAVYSNVMSEGYGEVDIEHMGPRFGPMRGQEMVYMVLKGRILKNDLKIKISEPFNTWTYPILNFTKNGNVVYFLMPAFPHPQFEETIKAYITVYYKDEELAENIYLYKKSLDEELAALNLNDSDAAETSSFSATNFNAYDLLDGTDLLTNRVLRKSPTVKRTTKRLNNKQK